MESLFTKYLKTHQKANYTQLCNYLYDQLRQRHTPDEDIHLLFSIKEKLGYLIYRSCLDEECDLASVVNFEESEKPLSTEVIQYRLLLQKFPDKRLNLARMVEEERRVFSFLHNVEGCTVKDLLELLVDLDYVEHFRLSRHRKSCVIQHDVDFSHQLSGVQARFDECYDAIIQHLDRLRPMIYRLDRENCSASKVGGAGGRSQNYPTERSVDKEIDKCRIRVDYLLFAMRHWMTISHEIKHIFNHSSIMAKMDSQIETLDEYIRNLLKRSFVMTRQPDAINIMQTPSTQRILKDREFVKASFLAYSPSCETPWIQITSTCQMYLVGLNEYKSSDSVFDDFSVDRKTAYEGDLYEPSTKINKNPTSNPHMSISTGDTGFPRVHMINQFLKRRCREISNNTNKRKHDDLANCNAAPEEIFSFVLVFKIAYDTSAPRHPFSESVIDSQRTLTIQTCSKPVAILVHASQRALAEGKLFWCRFNLKWHMPLHEETSVSMETFRKTLFEYTADNFARELSSRELDYLMAQIVVDQRQGYKLLAKSVLKEEAQYTDPIDNPPKRKSFWCWFYDVLVFLGKGKGKPSTKSNMESPLKKHWREGRVCLLSRTQAQDILTKLGPSKSGAIIRVSESKPRTLNVLSYNDSWGVNEKEVDGLDEHLRNKFSVIWSESKETWFRPEHVCRAEEPLYDVRYKRFGGSVGACMSPSTPVPRAPAAGDQPPHKSPVGYMSPSTPVHAMNFNGNYPGSPYIPVQGTSSEQLSTAAGGGGGGGEGGGDAGSAVWRTTQTSAAGGHQTPVESYISAFNEQAVFDNFNNLSGANTALPQPLAYNVGNLANAPSNLFHLMSLGDHGALSHAQRNGAQAEVAQQQQQLSAGSTTGPNIVEFKFNNFS